MNRLHAVTKIQRAVLDDGISDPKDVFQKLRFEIPNSGQDLVMERKEIEAFAAQSIGLVQDARFPVERERMRLDILEGELRADLLDAIAGIDISDPGVCRDVYELHRKVGSSTGAPTLQEAIDMLAVSKPEPGEDAIAGFVSRLEALYPKRDEAADE